MNYCFRGAFRPLSNIYNRAFLSKSLAAENRQLLWSPSFSKKAKFSEKTTFLTPDTRNWKILRTY